MRAAPAHEFPQRTANVRSSQKNISVRLNPRHQFADKNDRVVDVFDYLDSHGAVEIYIPGELLDPSDKYLGALLTGAGCTIFGKLSSHSTPEIRPGFVQKIAVA